MTMSSFDEGNGGVHGPRVVPLEPKNEMKGALDGLSRALPQLIEHAQLQAKIRRASYLALIDAGFNEVQALELCWK